MELATGGAIQPPCHFCCPLEKYNLTPKAIQKMKIITIIIPITVSIKGSTIILFISLVLSYMTKVGGLETITDHYHRFYSMVSIEFID